MTKAFLLLRIYLCKLLKNPHFIIKIKNNKVSAFSGRPKPNFIAGCQDIILRGQIAGGFIYPSKADKLQR